MNEHSSREQLHWVGVDVAKATFDAAVVCSHQHYPDTPLGKIPVHTFERSLQGVARFLAWLDAFEHEEDACRVIMEATGRYSTELAVWMLEQRPSLRPAIVNPYRTAAFIKSMGVRNKTDSLEARALGFYGVERSPMPYEPPSPERRELRELSRWRDYLVCERTRLKNKAKENQDSPYVAKMHHKRLRLLTADIQRVEGEMHDLVAQHPPLAHDIQLITTIYGIAFINAAMILAELGDLRRFTRARQLTAFAGMSPKHHQSGSSIHRRSRLCKQGNPRVRKGLYLSAMVAIRGNNQFRDTYQKLIALGKPKMVALIAVMRKILTVIRIMLIKNQPFKPMGITQT